MPPILSGPLFALLFFWLALALGSRLLLLARAPLGELTVWERGVVLTAIGAGALQYLPFALSLFGVLTSPFVRGCMAILALALAYDMWRVARALVRELRNLSIRAMSSPQIVWAAMIGVLLAVLLVRAVTFGELGDDDGIHLAAPKRWLHAGSLIYLPTYTHTTATLGFDMLYLIALGAWNAVGAKALHYGAGLFTLLGLALCGRRVSSALAGMVAVSLVLISTPFCNLTYVFCSAMIDLGAAWMSVSTALLWLAWRDTRKRELLVCMAVCAGLAASFKLTSLQVAIAWAPVLVIDSRRQGLSWTQILGRLSWFGTVAFIPVVPWLYRHWELTGNPLYPMFSSIFPTRDWTPEHALNFGRYLKYFSWGVAAGTSLTEEARKGLILLTVGLLSAGGFLVWWQVRKPTLRSIVIFATTFSVFSVILTGLIFRYWLPAILLVSLVVGTIVAERVRHPMVRAWLPLALVLVALGVEVRRGYQPHAAVSFLADLRMATGVSTYEREYGDQPLTQVWSYINKQTPVDAHIMIVAFYQTFGSSSYAGFWVDDRMCYTTDPHLQTYLRLTDWSSFVDSVRKTGIEYVVMSDTLFNPLRQGFKFPAVENEYPFSQRLVEEYGEHLFQAEFMHVYRIRL